MWRGSTSAAFLSKTETMITLHCQQVTQTQGCEVVARKLNFSPDIKRPKIIWYVFYCSWFMFMQHWCPQGFQHLDFGLTIPNLKMIHVIRMCYFPPFVWLLIRKFQQVNEPLKRGNENQDWFYHLYLIIFKIWILFERCRRCSWLLCMYACIIFTKYLEGDTVAHA